MTKLLLVLLALPLVGCPKPQPKPQPFPGHTTGAVTGSVDCSTFSGTYRVVDTVSGIPTCGSSNTTDILKLKVQGYDEDANQWSATVTTVGNQTLNGLAKHLVDNQSACRVVVEIDEALPQDLTVSGRDFVLGETTGKGRGEATVHDHACTWQSVSALELIP